MKNPSVSSEAPEKLILPDQQREEIIAHCRQEAPVEACGLISGQNEECEVVHRMTNADGEKDHYMMDPEEQFELFKKLRQTDQEVVAIYHSHPHTEAYPSPEDLRLAFYPGVIYIIVSLEEDEPTIRGFKIIDEEIEEVEIKSNSAGGEN